MDRSVLVERAKHTHVPEDFKEVHKDLKGLRIFWNDRWIYGIAMFLFLSPILLLPFGILVSTRDWNLFSIVPAIFMCIAACETQLVNQKICRYASYIVKTEQPRKARINITSMDDFSHDNFYRYVQVLDIQGDFPQTAKAYALSFREQSMCPFSCVRPDDVFGQEADVWYDPNSKEAIMLSVGKYRFWLQPVRSVRPTHD